MSKKFFGNFKVMAAIAAVVIFMMILYGYNRSERKKLAKTMPQAGQQLTTVGQKAAMQATTPYRHPNLAKPGGCGCGKK